MGIIVGINKGLGIGRSSQPSDVGDGLSIVSFFFSLFDIVLGGESSAGGVERVLLLHFPRDDIELPIHIYKNNKMENLQ